MSEKLEDYTKGTRVWFKDEEEGYVSATLIAREQNDSELTLTFTIDGSDRNVVYKQKIKQLEKTNYEDLPPLKNPPRLEGADDLTNLSYLHEAAVLHSVKIRYQQEIIYTYSGLVLIAMNPFRKLNIYSVETMRQYAGRSRQDLEPHLFAIAEEAYRKMIDFKENQSIIVSGESGAGKTQSAKYVMRYFAIVDELLTSGGGHRKSVDEKAQTTLVEDAVLSTNPIMEAFGNAKTTRNDNSSRFGKYIEILFRTKPKGNFTISGARMRTYLLERSRITFQAESERNYHIFYQLCAACPAAEKQQLGLDTWNKFNYLNQGKTGTVKGVDDIEEFELTQKSMSTVGISVSTQWDVFRVCAAILHIGNITITDNRGAANIDPNNDSLLKAASLLEVDAKEFHKWLVKKQIIMRSETILSDAKVDQAITSRDSIAKFIYSMLFDWIVKSVNNKLNELDTGSCDGKEQFIGVLDIYGFEHFQKNSFEQFCINFANEKLQQEFTRHVFKLEQALYVAEEISWSFINFNDNQPCIDMIEGKLGILDLLDEESRLPSGADKSLIQKLYSRYGQEGHKFFAKPRFGEIEFVIKHYALDVTYQIDGFIEKNKDTVSDEQLAMLNDSKFGFLLEVIKIEAPPEVENSSQRSGKSASRVVSKKPTLGSIFKGSLIKLMDTLRQTNPHFIRCIKPNQAKVAFEFEAQNVLGQLVACGVLETIKISRAGYPSKQSFEEFVARYYFLVPSSEWRVDPRKLTEKISAKHIKAGNFEMGKTKVFFRAGQMALLEKIRSEKFTKVVIFIQKNVIRNHKRQRFLKIKSAIKVIQKAQRDFKERQRKQRELEYKSAVCLQRHMRGTLQRFKYQKLVTAIGNLQKSYRRYAMKRDAAVLARRNAASKIAATFKMYRQRQKYTKDIQDIIKVQSVYRRKMARREFKQLKIESKSVGKLQETNYQLERKLFELSQALDDQKKENIDKQKQISMLEEQLGSLKEKHVKLEADLKNRDNDLESENSKLKHDLHENGLLREAQLKDNDKLSGMIKKRDDQISQLLEEKKLLENANEDLKLKLDSAPKVDEAANEQLKKEVASLRDQMSKLIAGKYRTDRHTERFLNNDFDNVANQPAPVHTSAAARMSMSFFESAAQVTARVAGNLGRSNDSLETRDHRPLRVRPIDFQDDSTPRDRPVRMLEARELQDEIIEKLIVNLRIPLPSTQTIASRKEIFFPAHLIGYLVSEMLQNRLIDRLREMLGTVTKAIHNLTTKFEDDYVSAFWLSNCYELLSVIKTARSSLPRPSTSSQDDEQSASAVLATIHSELKNVMIGIYNGWIKEFMKRLSNMIIPAVIENQSLPGYICKQSGGIWSQWASKSTPNSQYTIDQLLNFLTKLNKTIRCYYMEDSMSRQILTELVRIIGVTAFNHLLMRKNFCTWKRGVQIQYNVSRLEEWCSGHSIAEATLHLQQLLQASKLLTLNKTSASDIEIIFDVCFLLNPSQIKKLLSLYYAADFDSPLSNELLKIVSTRVSLNEDNDELLLDMDAAPDFVFPEARAVKHIEKFIPAWIELPYIQAVLSSRFESPTGANPVDAHVVE